MVCVVAEFAYELDCIALCTSLSVLVRRILYIYIFCFVCVCMCTYVRLR